MVDDKGLNDLLCPYIEKRIVQKVKEQ